MSKDQIELRGSSRFKLLARTCEEEKEYDLVQERHLEKPSGLVASVAQLVKGALGAGIMSGHVGYMFSGCLVGLVGHVCFGAYMVYCLYILIKSAQILCRRTRIPSMTYSDIGECAMICTEHPTFVRFAKVFRIFIDVSLCLDLFGACCAYQIMIAKGIKQLVEITPPLAQYSIDNLSIRMYLAMFIVPFMLIVMIRHLQWLAPLSVVANFVIVMCIGVTVQYALQNNPRFEDLVGAKDLSGFFKFAGISVFSMSCAGVVVAVENNMKEPDKFPRALSIGMCCIIAANILISFFGYAAFLEESESPITINFKMDTFPKILKISICIMIYVTHALNFWVPFNIVFYYIKPRLNQARILLWEYIFRGVICLSLTVTAIIFPNIASLLSLVGCVALVNIAFIWPNIIHLLVEWRRPGLGKLRWRLWKCLILITVGLYLFAAGTYVNLVSLFSKSIVKSF